MSTTKNGRRKKAIANTKSPLEVSRIEDKIKRVGEWKYKPRKRTAGKPDGTKKKAPKVGRKGRGAE